MLPKLVSGCEELFNDVFPWTRPDNVWTYMLQPARMEEGLEREDQMMRRVDARLKLKCGDTSSSGRTAWGRTSAGRGRCSGECSSLSKLVRGVVGEEEEVGRGPECE